MGEKLTDREMEALDRCYREAAGKGWEPRGGTDTPAIRKFVAAGFLRVTDGRSGFERIKDGMVTWTDAGRQVMSSRATIARLSEALAEAEKKGAEDWQSINTAPRDGTQILVYVPSGRREKDRVQAGSCARNLNKQDIWIIGNQFGFDVGEPTHWRPLPAPPRDLSQGGQHG